MPLEQRAICARRGTETPAHHTGHGLAEDRRMIFRFRLLHNALDSEPDKVLAQAREWTFVKEPGQIIRSIGQKFPTPEANKKIKVFCFDMRRVGTASGLCDSGMGEPEWARVAGQVDKAFEQGLVGSARQQ